VPAIRRRVASLYGEAESGERCPGDACSRYKSAAEPKIDACKSCVVCEGRGPVAEELDAEDVVEHIRWLALERDGCSHMFERRRLTDLEVELLLAWTEAREQYELLAKRKFVRLLETIESRGLC
jgi:hypothetical protein